jgi:phage tail protein X
MAGGEMSSEERVIPGVETSEEKGIIWVEKIFPQEEGAEEKEKPTKGKAIVKRKVIAVEEAMQEMINHQSPQEGETPRERLLYLKVGIPALFLACLAVFSLVIWFENRTLPLKEEGLNLSPHQKPIAQEEEKSIAAEEGWNLSMITKRFYGSTNPALIDLVLEANPQVSDLNRIRVQQSIKIPKIREELLLVEVNDHTYKIHLGTFMHRDQARFFEGEPFLKGKEFEIVPRKVSPRETWYRLLAGPFKTREEAFQTIQALKGRGLLPFFSGTHGES